MNQKKAKLIRRMVRASGAVMAEFPKHHVNMRGHRINSSESLFPVVVTAKYPDGSFQRKLREMKRRPMQHNGLTIKFMRHAMRSVVQLA